MVDKKREKEGEFVSCADRAVYFYSGERERERERERGIIFKRLRLFNVDIDVIRMGFNTNIALFLMLFN